MSYISPKPLPGLNVRDNGNLNLAKLICTGEKVIETRNSNSLQKYVGRRIRIIRTGIKNEKAQVIGECTLKSVKEYLTKEEFYKDTKLHLISENDPEYSFNGYKVGYIISNPILYPFTYKALGLGYVFRLNQPKPILSKSKALKFIKK